MKYRIVQVKTGQFLIQKRFLWFFWKWYKEPYYYSFDYGGTWNETDGMRQEFPTLEKAQYYLNNIVKVFPIKYNNHLISYGHDRYVDLKSKTLFGTFDLGTYGTLEQFKETLDEQDNIKQERKDFITITKVFEDI